ncbi:MAG: hypothetical protein DMG08_21645 [Acidobacteria bacterium]|nr:MAG: hypothetical protein DMG08_21645 [Acidobacteriota bacterium]
MLPAAIQTVTPGAARRPPVELRISDFGLRIVLIEKLFVNSESEIRNRNQRALLRVCVVNRALEFSSLPSRNFVGLVTA